MPKTVVFNVAMSCSGCSGAVTKILNKIEGVEAVEAIVETKRVIVTCSDSVESQVLLDALLKWSSASGKAVSLVSS